MPEVAIFSTSLDRPTYEPVVEILQKKGLDTFVYNSDKIACQDDSLNISVNSDGNLNLEYNDETVRLDQIKASWFRHPYVYNFDIEDKAKKMTLEHEIDLLQNSIWNSVSDEAWLNHPDKMEKARDKIGQLILAKSLGLKIPDTIVANNWGSIRNKFQDNPFIIKMPKGLIYENNKAKILYTTILNSNSSNELEENNPFPGIYQEYLEKRREWRITIVDDKVFEASVYTDKDAKDDWRKHQFSNKVLFKKEKMPTEVTEKCCNFLGKLGLLYGTFDLIENNEGEITFLECNTNGQYRWLEDVLQLPITEAIADSLIKIHSQNS